jgi:adenylate cyclase
MTQCLSTKTGQVQALAASPQSAVAHYAKGLVLRARDRYDEAIPEYETVLVFNRNWVDAIASLDWCRLFTGSIEEAIPLLEEAIRVSPRDPSIGFWYFRIGIAHLMQSRVDDAIVWAKKHAAPIPETRAVTPSSPPPMPSRARPNTPPRNSLKPGG